MGATFYAEPVLTFDLDVIVLLPKMQTGFSRWPRFMTRCVRRAMLRKLNAWS
jgi:hypothetical protein